MNRPILLSTLLFMAASVLSAQDTNQANPYQGTSTPPPDDTIISTEAPAAKPPAGRLAVPIEPQAPQPTMTQAAPSPAAKYSDPDAGIVRVEESSDGQHPVLTPRHRAAADPDGDIVHPQPLPPGELGEGTVIRVRLLDRLSTATSEKGDAFRSRVASDVVQDGQVLIPAGAEIDGHVAEVSAGRLGGRGSMRLSPETVILANGSRYTLRADLTGTPGSRTRVGGEGAIVPASRVRRDGLEYGGAVGAGAITGAVIAGPVGALTGSLIGAGAVTVHLLVNHPQATLEPETVLIFSLSEPVMMSR